MRAELAIGAAALWLAGCEYFGSDIATRIRFELTDARARLLASTDDSAQVEIRPNHWPDGCGKAARYRVVLKPYQGGKQVATGDILVFCESSRHYGTGMGSEKLVVDRELSVEKSASEAIQVTLRKVQGGVVQVTALR